MPDDRRYVLRSIHLSHWVLIDDCVVLLTQITFVKAAKCRTSFENTCAIYVGRIAVGSHVRTQIVLWYVCICAASATFASLK